MMFILIDVQPINVITPSIFPNKENHCSCSSKTNCLRLHCFCFKNGELCGAECSCKDCRNVEEYAKIREFVR